MAVAPMLPFSAYWTKARRLSFTPPVQPSINFLAQPLRPSGAGEWFAVFDVNETIRARV
jgi:hypothetical protein